MLRLGISGYMADFGEYLPVDSSLKFFNGESGLELHNQWPVLWAKLNRDAVEEERKLGKVVFWMRAGYTGTYHSLIRPRVLYVHTHSSTLYTTGDNSGCIIFYVCIHLPTVSRVLYVRTVLNYVCAR